MKQVKQQHISIENKQIWISKQCTSLVSIFQQSTNNQDDKAILEQQVCYTLKRQNIIATFLFLSKFMPFYDTFQPPHPMRENS